MSRSNPQNITTATSDTLSAAQYYENGINEYFYEDYEKAIDSFTKAIVEGGSDSAGNNTSTEEEFQCYVKRAYAYKRLGMDLDAVSDFKVGLALAQKTKDFESAQKLALTVANMLLDNNQVDESCEFYEKAKTLVDASASTTPGTGGGSGGAAALEALGKRLKSAGAKLAGAKNNAAAVHKPKYEYYQSDEFVVIDIFYKKLSKESVRTFFDSNAVSVFIKNADGTIVEIRFSPLFDTIAADRSSSRIMSTKLEIKLAKQQRKFWTSLEQPSRTNNDITHQANSSERGVGTSSRGRNWAAIEKEIDRELSLNEENNDLASLFSKIYRDADDDTRRAMMKSYTESNGTTLSTNWKDVSKGTVETKPPQGMEPKSFNS